MIDIKQPPNSYEAEQSVIGGLLLTGTAWLEIADIVEESDFYKPNHKLIFSEIKRQAESGNEYDAITLGESLESRGELDNAGGLSYLIELANNTPSAANIKAYSNIVREKSILRNIIKIASHFTDEAYNTNGKKSEEILNRFQDMLFNLAKNESRNLVSIHDAIGEFIEEIERRTNIDGLNGLSTGFRTIDNRLKGMKPSKLIIVAGRPSQGKTTYALNMCEHVALFEKKDVLIFSMEMDAQELVEKMISSQSSVPLDALEKAELSKNQWDDLAAGGYRLGESKIFIDDSPTQSWQSVRVAAKKHAAKNDLGMIMIDYLQLMDGDGKTQNEITSNISRNLKKLAKELKLPVILLSQLNRELEKRPDKRPKMSDLRDSGAIEQDADIIQFIYRDEYYYPECQSNKGVAEIITSKFRGGKVGKNLLLTQLDYSRFKDMQGVEQYIPYEPKSSSGGFKG